MAKFTDLVLMCLLVSNVQVETSNRFMLGMIAILAVATAKLGPLAMFNLYVMPYWINVIWLDIVTYLHHHGAQDADEQVPWYRGKVSCRLEHCLS